MPISTFSIIKKIADGVVTHVRTLTGCGDARRSYSDWALDLRENVWETKIDVVPATDKIKTVLLAKNKLQYTVPVDIIIRQKFGPEVMDNDEQLAVENIDRLVLFGERIHEAFTPKRLTAFEEAIWKDTQILFLPHPMTLFELHMFLGVIRVTFQANRTVDVAGAEEETP